MSRFLEVQVDTSEVMKALEEMQRRSLNLRPFMGAVGIIMLKSTDENFEKQGRPKWKGWSPLTKKIYEGLATDRAKATKAYQKAKSKGQSSIVGKYVNKYVNDGAILAGDGNLKKSVVVGNLTNESVEVGSSLVYSRIHQLGGVITPKKAKALLIPLGGGSVLKLKKVTIPARPYLKLQETDYKTMIKVAKDYLTRGEIG